MYFETKCSSFERVAKREDNEFSKRLQSSFVATDFCFSSPCFNADDVIAATAFGFHQIRGQKKPNFDIKVVGFAGGYAPEHADHRGRKTISTIMLGFLCFL